MPGCDVSRLLVVLVTGAQGHSVVLEIQRIGARIAQESQGFRRRFNDWFGGPIERRVKDDRAIRFGEKCFDQTPVTTTALGDALDS